MPRPLILHPDRLFPADAGVRTLARSLYAHVQGLPIISPHGHTDPAWFAYDEPFGDAVDLLLAPDHYLYRMLYSQGVLLDKLGVRTRQGAPKRYDLALYGRAGSLLGQTSSSSTWPSQESTTCYFPRPSFVLPRHTAGSVQ